jgi:hypothetical protein
MASLGSARGLTHSQYTSAGCRLTTLNGTVVAPPVLASRRAPTLLGCRSSRTYAALAYSLPEDLCSASAIWYRSRLPRPSLLTEVSSRISWYRLSLFARASSRILSLSVSLVGLVSALQSLAGSRGVACRCSLGPLAGSYRALVGVVSSLKSLAGSRGVAGRSE